MGTKKALTLIAAGTIISATAQTNAAITYVDIDATNTVGDTGDAAFATVTDGTSDAWEVRAPFGNAGELLQSTDEDSPVLRTTIGGLTAGVSYNIHVLFWGVAQNEDDNFWQASAGFLSDLSDQTVYNEANGAVVSMASDFSNAPLVAEGNRVLLRDLVGVAVADSNGEIAVYLDDVVPQGGRDRTWLDGVGYEVVPEPSSLALLGLGGLAMLHRRRH
ncbi:MAG: PEP-CTERM sorting domain-containing protein [Planctomycetota bacterium]